MSDRKDWAPNMLTLRLGSMLLANGGRMPDGMATALVPRSLSRPGQRVVEALQPLIDDDVAFHADGAWYAINSADLAAWIADGYEAREDAGLDTGAPRPGDIPEQRGRRRPTRAAA
jgi:hypothetical protein